MKTIYRKILALCLILSIFASAIIVIDVANSDEVLALSSGYDGESNTIYYFFDFYPTISPTTMTAEYGETYNIVYDRYDNIDSFETMVKCGYFSGFGSNCTVIIDLKLIYPEALTLYNLFYSLKETQNCKTMLITTYITDFEYVDVCFVATFSRLNEFINESLRYLIKHNGTLSNTVFLIDGNIVSSTKNYSELITYNVFMRLLVENIEELAEEYLEDTNGYTKGLS